MQELIAYNAAEAENLLGAVKSFLMSKGIMLRKKYDAGEKSQAETLDDSPWVKPFIIQTETPAFYLELNSPDDIERLNSELESRLNELQGNLKTFLQNNSDLDEALANKINMIASSNLTRAKQAIKFGLKKNLNADAQKCNSVAELREAAGRRYEDFLKQNFMERIMVPLYEGLRQTPKEPAYLWVLNEANNFLADLGVVTVNISVGELYDENSPYVPSEESQSEKFATTDAQEKDTVREILRYAYAFQEDNGARIIMDGEVIVMVYRPEGAQ